MLIYESTIDKKICKNIIDVYEKSSKKSVNNNYVNMSQVNVNINDSFLFSYIKELTKIKNEYIKKYEYINKEQELWDIYPNIKIQKYQPNESYSAWHSEIDGLIKNQKRILVFTTYLNDLKKGGETEFFYQKNKIKPKEGLTILFPPFWTHTHKGNITKETKYIITGWYTYVH